MITIEFSNRGKPDNYDWSPLVNKAVLEATENTTLLFEEGTYFFYSKYAYEQHCYITNNDHSQKRIAFPIMNKKGITIDGGGAKFIFVGRILPFFLVESKDICLKNFTIDYKRPLYSQGEVLEGSHEHVVLKIDKEQFPYKVVKDHFVFIGDEYESIYVHGMLEFDKKLRKPVFGAKDNHVGGELKGREIEEGIIEILSPFKKIPKAGSMLTIKHERRFVPGIAIDHTDGCKLDNINIRAAGTMGIVAQYSKNISLNRIVVAVEKGSDRMVSVNADATHFVGCQGFLHVNKCVFEHQLDDAINVHGNYLDIEEVVDEKTVIAKIGHFQQVGVFGLEVGTKIQLLDSDTMLNEQVLTLASKEVINNQYIRLYFKEVLAIDPNRRYSLEDIEAYPVLTFTNNIVRKNRARGILLTSRKAILIEGNRIEAEGTAIKISGDTNSWHESGPIGELIIRGNHIESVNEDVWGRALIDIDPEMVEFEEGRYYHNTIIVENNTLVLGARPLFYGQSFNKLILKNNTYIKKGDAKVTMEIKNYGEVIEKGVE